MVLYKMSGIKIANIFLCLFWGALYGLAAQTGAVHGKHIVCYYSSWSAHRPDLGSYTIDDIPINMCTHLVYSFIGLNNRTWELLVLDPANDITKGGYRRFTSLKKRNPNLKTLISVGGWVEGGRKYSELASKPERRKVFVNSVVDFLKWFNFDGLDLDWEFPGSADREGRAEDKDNFLQLVTELREAFDKEGWGWSLSAVVPIMPFRVDTGYHVEKLSSMFDHIHLLTYDLRGNWTGFADVHTPLNQRHFDAGDYKNVNMNDGAELWERMGAPKEKLLIGLALYGRSYTLADVNNRQLHAPLQNGNTAGHAGQYTKANGTLAYYEICQLQREGDWEQNYDETSESSYMVKGDQWVGFDDRENLVKKVKYFQDKGYGGVSVWAADLDDFRGLCGEPLILMSAIYKQMTGRSALSAQSFPSTSTFTSSTFPPLPSIASTPRPLVTQQLPQTVTSVTPLRADELQTPSTLSFFEDSQRLQPNIDHSRSTVSPLDAISSPPLTPSVNVDLPRPLTQRPPLRRRPTTQPLRVTTTTTIASVPREETIPQQTNIGELDASVPEIQPTEPAVQTTAETTAAPITRRPFGGRPLRTRGRRPVVATDSDSHASSVAPRNRTRPVNRQPGRRITRPTTTTAVPVAVPVTVPVTAEITTTLPTTTTTTATTTTKILTTVVTTTTSAATAAQPIATEQATSAEAEPTTVAATTKRPFQRRLRRPLNRTGPIGRVRRPTTLRPVVNNLNDTELTAEESQEIPVAVRFPLPRVPKIWKPDNGNLNLP